MNTGLGSIVRKPPFQLFVVVDFIGMEKHASYFSPALVIQVPTGMVSAVINLLINLGAMGGRRGALRLIIVLVWGRTLPNVWLGTTGMVLNADK